MTYVTGDTHIPIDIDKLNVNNFYEQKNLTKEDYLIITGDFGGIWSGDERDDEWLDWLEKKNFTTLFVDGNHENFDLLNAMPVGAWNGGNVHFVRPSVIHLMRGQVFTINKLKFFTFGGGYSIDKARRTPGLSWWAAELPTWNEIEEGLTNLDLHDWVVDYVVTHTGPSSTGRQLGYTPIDGELNQYFEDIRSKLQFKRWFLGHYHQDVHFGDMVALYHNIKEVD